MLTEEKSYQEINFQKQNHLSDVIKRHYIFSLLAKPDGNNIIFLYETRAQNPSLLTQVSFGGNLCLIWYLVHVPVFDAVTSDKEI